MIERIVRRLGRGIAWLRTVHTCEFDPTAEELNLSSEEIREQALIREQTAWDSSFR